VSLNDLLTPSLASARDVRSLYSARANILVAFIGGVFAAIVMGVANSLRARRLESDWPLYLLAFLAWSGFLVWYMRAVVAGTPPPFADLLGRPSSTLNYLGRAAGVALFGLVYSRHRLLFRAAETFGVAAPKPWKIGSVAVAGGALVTVGFTALGAVLGR
jgi:hypothetical protein